jgi:FlaA1/EpsC-like NDP-sugar epimerase
LSRASDQPCVIASLDYPMTSASLAAPSFEQASPAAAPTKAPLRRLSRKVIADTVAAGDICAVVVGGLNPALIYALIGNVSLDQVLVIQSSLIAGFITHLCLRVRGMYDTSRMDKFPQSPVELFAAVCCGLIVVLGIGLPLALHNIHLVVWYSAWVSSSFTLILLNRLVARNLIARLAKAGRFDERIAVFGAGQIARNVHDYLSVPQLGIFFTGVFDDRIGQDRINPEGLTVAGKLEDLVALCREGKVDRIVVALPQAAYTRLAGIVEKFADLPVSTHIVTHIASDLIDGSTAHKVSNLGNIGLLDVKKKH